MALNDVTAMEIPQPEPRRNIEASRMTLAEHYAGEAIRALVSIYPVPGTNEDYRGEYILARWAFQIGEAMEAEAIRRRGGA